MVKFKVLIPAFNQHLLNKQQLKKLNREFLKGVVSVSKLSIMYLYVQMFLRYVSNVALQKHLKVTFEQRLGEAVNMT